MTPVRFITLVLSGVVAAAVVWLYAWTVGFPRIFAGQRSDYYNLLVDGFQQGSLAMKVAVNPSTPGSPPDPFLLDASFYQGRYYLYFGVTPAVLLFWPWTAVTGQDLPEAAAVALLATLAFGLSLGWLATLRRSFFHTDVGSGLWSWLVAVVALGLAAGYPVVLRRPLFYEVAILANAACTMGALWCLTLALIRREQDLRWLALASLCAGLAVGSRPTVGPGALLALGLTGVFLLWRQRPTAEPAGRVFFLRLVLAAGLPVGGCLVLLAWYNLARFGSPWEFGLSHQQGSNPQGFAFSVSSLWKNLGLYYLTPPSFSWYFPFFGPGDNPPGINREQVHGQFFTLPLFGLAGMIAFRTWWRKSPWPAELGLAVAGAAIWAGATLLIEGMAPPHANRYQLDFHPVFLVLSLLTLFASLGRPGWRGAGRAGLFWLLFVALFNVCTSFHVHGFFKDTYPDEQARLARIVNRDYVWPLLRLFRPAFGGMEAVVRFPKGRPGVIEPLLTTGGGPDMDALFVRYTTPGRGQLVFDHLDYGGIESEEFDLLPGRARWLKIEHGGLYPPPGHPWYKDQPAGLARSLNRIAVRLDGATVMDRDMIFYQASPNQLSLGRRNGYLKGEDKFSGEIALVRSLAPDTAWLEGSRQARGAVRLKLLLPRDRFGAEEPLLLSGVRGRSDLVSIAYLRDGQVRFSVFHDGWSQARRSAAIEWDYLVPMDVLIHLDVRPGQTESDGVCVEIEDRVVWRSEFQAYPAEPLQQYIGCLPWPVQGYWRIFGGRLLSSSREDAHVAPLRQAGRALLSGHEVKIEFTLPTEVPISGLPLFSTGITGRGDSLYLEYLPDGMVRFGFDHWGSQPRWSLPVRLKPGRSHRLEVSLGARLSPVETVRGRVRVSLEGQPLLDEPVDLFPCDVDQLWFGENRPGLSTSLPKFTGEITVSAGGPLP